MELETQMGTGNAPGSKPLKRWENRKLISWPYKNHVLWKKKRQVNLMCSKPQLHIRSQKSTYQQDKSFWSEKR